MSCLTAKNNMVNNVDLKKQALGNIYVDTVRT